TCWPAAGRWSAWPSWPTATPAGTQTRGRAWPSLAASPCPCPPSAAASAATRSTRRWCSRRRAGRSTRGRCSPRWRSPSPACSPPPTRRRAAPPAAVLAGDRSPPLARPEPDGPRGLGEAELVACAAKRDGDGWTLTGTKTLVCDAAIAADAVVAARAEDGVALFLVDLAANGAVVVARSTVDTTRRRGDLILDAPPAGLLVPASSAGEVLAATHRRALALAACEAVGGAGRALAFAPEEAGQRG